MIPPRFGRIVRGMNILLFFPFDARPGPGERFFLPRGDSRAEHVVKVLRLGPGDAVHAGLADGPAGTARILEATADGILFGFAADPVSVHPFLFPVTLVVGQVRPICAKRVLREAAMLGAASIVFTGTDLGEKSYREAKLWESGEAGRYLLDGVVQAGATAVPKLRLYDSVEACLDGLDGGEAGSGYAARIALDNEAPGAPLTEFAGRLPLVVAVGSERGWSARERELFRDRGWNFAGLGPRILRTETACAAALSILLATGGALFSSRYR